jgi:hypothetical protein
MSGSPLAGARRATRARPDAGVTADLVARAVIAAAAVYGDDPAGAVAARAGRARRCLAPAAAGLARALGLSERRGARLLGLSSASISRAGARHGSFALAVSAARAAVERAAGRDMDASPVLPLSEPEPIVLPPAALRIETSAPATAGDEAATWTPVKFAPGAPVKGRTRTVRAEPELIPRAPSVELTAARAAPVGPIYRGPMTPAPGRVAALGQPSWSPPPRLADEPASLRSRILAELGRRLAVSAPTLATILDAKELYVGQTLNNMAREGLTQPGPVGEAGARHRAWSLDPEWAAAGDAP